MHTSKCFISSKQLHAQCTDCLCRVHTYRYKWYLILNVIQKKMIISFMWSTERIIPKNISCANDIKGLQRCLMCFFLNSRMILLYHISVCLIRIDGMMRNCLMCIWFDALSLLDNLWINIVKTCTYSHLHIYTYLQRFAKFGLTFLYQYISAKSFTRVCFISA